MNNRVNPNQHNRQSIRLRGWDYTTPGAYFITICTHHREHLFGDRRFKEIAEYAWLAIPTQDHAQHVRLDEWVVMPNHVHGILVLVEMDGGGRGEAGRNDGRVQNHLVADLPRPYMAPGSIGAIVGNFKSLTARRINNIRRTPAGPVWQRGYYDRIVRDERALNAIRAYIQQNPARWAEDRDNLEALFKKMDLRP